MNMFINTHTFVVTWFKRYTVDAMPCRRESPSPMSCSASQRLINASVKPLASRGGMRTSSRQSFKNTMFALGSWVLHVGSQKQQH